MVRVVSARERRKQVEVVRRSPGVRLLMFQKTAFVRREELIHSRSPLDPARFGEEPGLVRVVLEQRILRARRVQQSGIFDVDVVAVQIGSPLVASAQFFYRKLFYNSVFLICTQFNDMYKSVKKCKKFRHNGSRRVTFQTQRRLVLPGTHFPGRSPQPDHVPVFLSARFGVHSGLFYRFF